MADEAKVEAVPARRSMREAFPAIATLVDEVRSEFGREQGGRFVTPDSQVVEWGVISGRGRG